MGKLRGRRQRLHGTRVGELRRRAGAALGLTVALGAGVLGLVETVGANDASGPDVVAAAADGPPVVSGTQPHTSATGGGVPIRIYGSGFEGTTSVRFELYTDTNDYQQPRELIASIDALDFEVIDGTLLTAVTPPSPAWDNLLIEIAITDDEGTTSDNPDWMLFYTDATLTVSPDTGLEVGDELTATITGGRPGLAYALGEINPLAGYLENIPNCCNGWPPGPPPYVALQFFPTLVIDTDGNGTQTLPLPPTIEMEPGEPPYDPFRPQYDANSSCPVNQETADFGLPRCFVVATLFSVGSLEYYISQVGDPVPADPALTLGASTAAVGDSVSLDGATWNAAALFGSDTDPDDPGETLVTVELCDTALAACVPAGADAEVEMTRYFDNGPGVPADDDLVNGVFIGATLSGTFTVPDGAGCAPGCVVRVTQERFSPHTMAPVPGEVIEATAPLEVSGEAGPSIDVGLTTTPASVVAPGGEVVFAVEVTNTGSDDVTLTGLVDDVYGDLVGPDSDCLTGATIGPDDAYACTFNREVTGEEGDIKENTVTATVTDGDGAVASASATATVAVTAAPTGTSIEVELTADPTTLPDGGGTVTFTVEVTNTGAAVVTVTGLVDDVYGDLDGQGSCSLFAPLAPGETYSCSFDGEFLGGPGDSQTSTVEVTAEDDDFNVAVASDDVTVSIEAGPGDPMIEVTKTALPVSLPEPGGTFAFTVAVDNTGEVPVTVTALDDDIYLDLDGQGDCATGTALAPDEEYSCSFEGDFTGVAGESQTDVVTVTATGDDGTEVTATASATVAITEPDDPPPPTISVDLDAEPPTLPEPGGDFPYTVVVTNTGTTAVTLSTLVDTVYGDLTVEECPDAAGFVLGGTGDTYTCTFDGSFTGLAGDSQVSEVTATAEDEDGNLAPDSDDTTVDITAAPVLTLGVTVTADPQTVDAPGEPVAFTVTVHNDAAAAITLDTLESALHGDLDGQGTCTTGGDLFAGANLTCTYTSDVAGAAGDSVPNQVTATATNGATGTGSATVDVTADGNPDPDPDPVGDAEIAVAVTAAPASMPEPGGPVDYTATVTNTGEVAVTLTGLSDGADLNGQGDCATGGTMAAGGAYTCTYSRDVTGDAGESFTTTVTATAEPVAPDTDDSEPDSGDDTDDDTVLAAVSLDAGVAATATGNATVLLLDALPTITVTKTATPVSLAAPGGEFSFEVEVTNTSGEAVVIAGLDDDVYGDLGGQGDCATGQTMAVDQTYACTYRGSFTAGAESSQTSTVTATATDNEANTATNTASAKVSLTASSSSSSGSGSSPGSGSSGNPASSGGSLPRTGLDPARELRLALGLALGGTAMVLASRGQRRRLALAAAAGEPADQARYTHHGPGAQMLPHRPDAFRDRKG